jgi:hypothetical protein
MHSHEELFRNIIKSQPIIFANGWVSQLSIVPKKKKVE